MTSNAPAPRGQLPRLLYVGDVPVESSYHGSALIYRLLQNYPPERLRIVEGNLRRSLPGRRLAAVAYDSVRVGWRRPLYTRFNSWARLAYSLTACRKAGAVERALAGFRPQCVLTVAHDFLWLTAARYAERESLPVHLICHDDWPRLARVPGPARPWLESGFGRVYRQAVSRLCVSPYMAAEYERRYAAAGTVLYPSRAADAPSFDAPPERLGKSVARLTIAFAGTVNSTAYLRSLGTLGRCLEGIGGRLLLFGPLAEADAVRAGLDRRNIEVRGMVSSDELIRRVRAEVDALFIPMSFAPEERECSALSFPSKLADYTAAGLPLLIFGPPYCSAARWAGENPGVAEVVTQESPGALGAALERLSRPGLRAALGEAALRLGNGFFSHAAAERFFFRG